MNFKCTNTLLLSCGMLISTHQYPKQGRGLFDWIVVLRLQVRPILKKNRGEELPAPPSSNKELKPCIYLHVKLELILIRMRLSENAG